MKVKIKEIAKQSNLPWIGPLKDIAMSTVFYMSIINFILIAVTAYYTTLRPFLLVYAPWFKVWMWLGLLVIIVLVMMVLEYKFVYASWYTFRNRQEFEHENLIRKEIQELRKDLGLRKKEDADETDRKQEVHKV